MGADPPPPPVELELETTDDRVLVHKRKAGPVELIELSGTDFDELTRSGAQSSQDLTFATTALGVALTAIGAIASTPVASTSWRIVWFALLFVTLATALYTGIKWHRAKKSHDELVQKIRGRKAEQIVYDRRRRAEPPS